VLVLVLVVYWGDDVDTSLCLYKVVVVMGDDDDNVAQLSRE
jgi:hypothetical protein